MPAVRPEGDIPLTAGEAGSANDIAETVLFLASDRHVTSPARRWVDGGRCLLR